MKIQVRIKKYYTGTVITVKMSKCTWFVEDGRAPIYLTELC